MKTVSIHDAKTNLSKYIVEAKKGKKIYIGGFGQAEVVLSKIPSGQRQSNVYRSFSIAKGKVTEKPGAFSQETDQAVSALMYGE